MTQIKSNFTSNPNLIIYNKCIMLFLSIDNCANFTLCVFFVAKLSKIGVKDA